MANPTLSLLAVCVSHSTTRLLSCPKYTKGMCWRQQVLRMRSGNSRVNFPPDSGLKGSSARGIILPMQYMKMLFSARDVAHIEPVREKLTAAGVRCEIRDFPTSRARSAFWYPELWVQSNGDYDRGLSHNVSTLALRHNGLWRSCGNFNGNEYRQ